MGRIGFTLPRPLWAAGLIYLVLRGMLLGSRFEELCLPAYELTMLGNIAHSAASGWNAPQLAQYYDNCGGHLVCGLLAAPLYALLGHSYLTLKLVPLLFGLCTMVVLWAIVAPRAGRQAAALTVFSFALGPPLLARLSVIALGNHFEGLLPLGVTYLLWLRWVEHEGDTRRGILFGLCASFAVFFYFGALLWLVLLAAGHLYLRGPRRFGVEWLRALPGLIAGAAPLIWIQLATDGRPLRFLSANLGAGARPTLSEAFERAVEFTTDVLPRAGLYPDVGVLGGVAAEASLLLASVAAWIVVARGVALRRRELGWLLPLVLYLPALVASHAFSRFKFPELVSIESVVTRRYLAPHLMVVALLLGFALAELLRPQRRRPLAAVVLIALSMVTAPFALALALPPAQRSPAGADYAGWSGPYLARVILRDSVRDPATGALTWDWPSILPSLEHLPERERGDVLFGVGYYTAWTLPDDPAQATGELLRRVPPTWHAAIGAGLGAFLRTRARAGTWPEARIAAYLDRLACSEPTLAMATARGLAREFENPLGFQTRGAFDLSCALGRAVPPALRPAWAAGLADEYALVQSRAFAPEILAARQSLAELPRDDSTSFWSVVRTGVPATASHCARP